MAVFYVYLKEKSRARIRVEAEDSPGAVRTVKRMVKAGEIKSGTLEPTGIMIIGTEDITSKVRVDLPHQKLTPDVLQQEV